MSTEVVRDTQQATCEAGCPSPARLAYGALRLPTRYLLSPLAGFTNLPFRRVIREIGGCGLTTTDLVNARALLAGRPRACALIAAHPQDTPFAVQIFGHEPSVLRDAAQLLESRGVDAIDINMGCPVDKVTRTGGGAALLQADDFDRNPNDGAGSGCPSGPVPLVQAVVEAVRVPVTVKMRLGWDARQITAPRFAREFEQIGVAAVAIHGRTREQGFTGTVDRHGIRQVVKAVSRIPVIGNGDIRSIDDAAQMFAETGCHGISVGRGALANPWIFRQLVQWETTGSWTPAGSFDERLELLQRQFGYLCEQYPVPRAISLFRRMGHWYLKGMHVRAGLRHRFQLAGTIDALHEALAAIREAGPAAGGGHDAGARSDPLPSLHVPVPSGPVERW